MEIGIFSVADAYPEEINRNAKQFYAELLEQIELADQLGFDSFWIAEHHFHQYGVIPRAAAWLAAASQRTKRIRLGAAVVVLPFDNPLRTAEDYAMVDVLSDGRLSLGVGSGYLSHEFEGFGIPIEEKRERFNEALAILNKAWSGERFSFQGQFHRLNEVAINVQPVQRPRPPLAVAILNTQAARHVGEQQYDLMLIPYASCEHGGELAQITAAYREGLERSSQNHGGKRVYFALHTHCAETIEASEKEAKPRLERYVRTRLYARQRPFDQLRDCDLLAIGDPARIKCLLKRYSELGLTNFLAITNFGGMPHDLVCSSMKLLANNVLGAF